MSIKMYVVSIIYGKKSQDIIFMLTFFHVRYVMLLARREKESKQRKSNGRPVQDTRHDTKYLTLSLHV